MSKEGRAFRLSQNSTKQKYSTKRKSHRVFRRLHLFLRFLLGGAAPFCAAPTSWLPWRLRSHCAARDIPPVIVSPFSRRCIRVREPLARSRYNVTARLLLLSRRRGVSLHVVHLFAAAASTRKTRS